MSEKTGRSGSTSLIDIKIEKEFIDKQLSLFSQTQAESDQAIMQLIQKFPENLNLSHILPKVCVINSIYGANILATYKMAKHIERLNIDKMLKSGDTGVVDMIAVLEVVPGKTRCFYSFATKYCNWHQQGKFPIFDSIVENFLWQANKLHKFSLVQKRAELRVYPKYKAFMDDFIRCFGLQSYNYKELDMALWQYGKNLMR